MVVESLERAWPPFALVIGLLLVGRAADRDGLFEAIAWRIARTSLPPRCLLACLLALVAVVTAVLNLDTSVVFLTRCSCMPRDAVGSTSVRSSTAPS